MSFHASHSDQLKLLFSPIFTIFFLMVIMHVYYGYMVCFVGENCVFPIFHISREPNFVHYYIGYKNKY